jgi:integrase
MPRPRKPWFRKATGWWMVEVGGRQVKLAQGRDRKTEAELKYHKLMAEIAANPPVDGGDPTVASIADAYLDYAQRRDSTRTYYERKLILQEFVDAHGYRRVKDCLPYHLTSWLDAHETWKSDWTRSTALKIVQRPFNWATKQGLIPASPFANVTQATGERRRPMTEQEYARLRNVTRGGKRTGRAASSGRRLREILFFMKLTGARPSELRNLRWSDIDPDRGVITLTRHKTSRTQKTPRPRVIQLVPATVKVLALIRRRGEVANHVFVTHLGTPWARNSLQQKVKRLRSKAGLADDAKLYGLRHHFGTRAIVNGVDLKTLAELMGHATTRMTEHYVHLAGQQPHLASAMRRATGCRPDA